MILSTLAVDSPSSPCYFTNSKLPTELSAKRYPKKRKPFSTIDANPLLHTVRPFRPKGLEIAKSDTARPRVAR
jgi:hypothetical protein